MRWVRYNDKVFNIDEVTCFDIQFEGLYVCFHGVTFWDNEEMDIKSSLRIAHLKNLTKDVQDVIDDILSGKHDIELTGK